MIKTNNRIAWITGGGTGIGKELAFLLSDNNYKVIVSGRRKEKLIETIKYNKKKIFSYPMDVSNQKDCENVSKKILKEFGSIDLLILNAAVYSPGTIKNFKSSEAKKIIDINLLGALYCLSPVIKFMKLKKLGHLVFISSPAGYQGLPGGGFYGMTKSALTFLAETLRMELGDFGIKVQVVNPGFVKTAMTDKNPFFMPFLMTPKLAAQKIFKKLSSNNFEIFFPKKLILPMKLFKFLPYQLYFFLMKKFIKVPK